MLKNKDSCFGITMRIINNEHYHEPRDALAHDWFFFIKRYFPESKWLLIPNLGGKHVIEYCKAHGVNRLILTGGENIGSFTKRDETENALLSWSCQNKIPVLGICRGMQHMAIFRGGKLKKINNHVAKRHKLHGCFTHVVNSYHEFSLESCPENFQILAYSDDNQIEAFYDPINLWEGWMWHPEREKILSELEINRIRTLFA